MSDHLFKPRRYIFPELKATAAVMNLECVVQPHPFWSGQTFDVLKPGELRDFEGRIDFPLRALEGLCATSGLRAAVHFEFDEREYGLVDRVVRVRVTLDKKAATARVQPALHVAGIDSFGVPHHEWRTILPLTPVALKREPDERGPAADRIFGPEVYVTDQPQILFRGQQLVVESAGYQPSVYILELRAGNLPMWCDPVPAGIFLKTDDYEPPLLDIPTLHPAQRFVVRAASKGRAATLKMNVHGTSLEAT